MRARKREKESESVRVRERKRAACRFRRDAPLMLAQLARSPSSHSLAPPASLTASSRRCSRLRSATPTRGRSARGTRSTCFAWRVGSPSSPPTPTQTTHPHPRPAHIGERPCLGGRLDFASLVRLPGLAGSAGTLVGTLLSYAVLELFTSVAGDGGSNSTQVNGGAPAGHG